MNKEDDRNWSAYIDGELSVSEVEDFEASLTEEELIHLNNERAFEEKVGSAFKDAPSCPADLLNDVLKEIDNEGKNYFLVYKLIGVAAIAALLAFIFLLPKAGTQGPKVPMTVAELQKMSLTGDKLDDINSYLSKRNISLELTKFMPEHHEKTIIGAAVEMIAGEEVVTLMFTCCGRPAKIYLLPKGSDAERLILEDDKEWKSSIQAQAKKGNYRLAVSSPHNSESLLAYINHT